MTEETQYPELRGFYYIHEEVGHGGFGKVKLATHLLTGQKVAIKIIDKKAVGDDLPRVATEMDALRNLSHQNICRLYQFIENYEKFFIVMEFCSGGEMFDYIVRKERLEESEARHFFRQLVQAMAYVHSQGYAHRDLKPENLLLTEDLHLKVIDFGLCAKPGVLSNPLSTCCGSPAYAAPELISGRDYRGDRADIWSMGVLLYTLVCGALPFEDDNNAILFKKIQTGSFYMPDFLSTQNRQLLSAMLTVDPERRITMKELIMHPWLNYKYSHPVKWTTIYDKNIVDEDVARELAYHHGLSLDRMMKRIKEWKFDYLTASYYLLLHMKRKGEKFNLPPPHFNSKGDPNIIASPTIHASLDKHLDRLDIEDSESSGLSSESDSSREIRFARPLSPDRDKKSSYVHAMLNMPSVCTGRSPQQRLPFESPNPVTPVRHKTVARPQASLGFEPGYVDRDKENRSATMRVRGPVKVMDDGTQRPKSIYSTPQRPALKALFSPGSGSRQRAKSTERARSGSPSSVGSGSGLESLGRTPRSSLKTPRLRQRVFASLERKKDAVINMLTPRKLKSDPQVLKSAKGMVNVSMTSSKDPDRVKAELIQVFEQQEIQYECNGWKISGRKKDKNHEMTVELEVVFVESLGSIGIRRKRLAGDAFLYKKVCEQILKMAGL
ncbi:unnamed protein product [Auanema sp. JU1783]|nr:unnamed protein product [Auanema sp. JU1783]